MTSTLSAGSEPSSFDREGWILQCNEAAKHAHKGCGLSYDWYVERISAAIDGLLKAVPAEHQEEAIKLATTGYSYATEEEREETRTDNSNNGYCMHGIELGYCPAGCGSGPDDD